MGRRGKPRRRTACEKAALCCALALASGLFFMAMHEFWQTGAVHGGKPAVADVPQSRVKQKKRGVKTRDAARVRHTVAKEKRTPAAQPTAPDVANHGKETGVYDGDTATVGVVCGWIIFGVPLLAIVMLVRGVDTRWDYATPFELDMLRYRIERSKSGRADDFRDIFVYAFEHILSESGDISPLYELPAPATMTERAAVFMAEWLYLSLWLYFVCITACIAILAIWVLYWAFT